MEQYINKSALVAELERRISVLKANESVISMLAGGMFVNEFKDLLSFLDTILDTLEMKEVEEEPVSNDLEEAAIEYCSGNKGADARVRTAFCMGAQWQKEQMITKACEWLRENKDHPLIGCEDPCLSGYLTDEFIEDFKKAMEE